MPELPEVEVVRRGLQASVLERTVDRIEVRQPRLRWPVPADLPQRLAARRVLAGRARSRRPAFPARPAALQRSTPLRRDAVA